MTSQAPEGNGNYDVEKDEYVHFYLSEAVDAGEYQNGTELFLMPSAPNPFSSETRIKFFAGRALKIQAAIYDISGRKIKNLLNGEVREGWHTVSWDGTNSNGLKVASGVYFMRFQTSSNRIITKKLIFLR